MDVNFYHSSDNFHVKTAVKLLTLHDMSLHPVTITVYLEYTVDVILPSTLVSCQHGEAIRY